jgi:hypothetical protein
MVKLHKIAGSIVKYLDAFKGSRPALDSQFILIVRGISSKNIAISEMSKVLNDLIKNLNGIEIDEVSEDASKLINRMDEQIRLNVEIGGDTDAGGISRMKNSLKELNVAVEYKLFNLPHAGVFVVIWKEKTDTGPVFIEVVVSDDEKDT